jgi:hypothetical protein
VSGFGDLEAAILAILREKDAGVSEFELFAELAKAGFAEFDREVFRDSMRMFRSHFVLFHVLYAMRERLILRHEGALEISALAIRLRAFDAGGPTAGSTAMAEHDPLRDYYLDLANLDATTEEDLRSMLDQFWERFAADDRRGEALRALGLAPDSPWDEVKARHRALVFEHHPDRGGDGARLAEINAAMRILERASKCP